MNKKVIAGIVMGAAMLPILASAQTTDVQSQIQSLLSQIQALQVQLKTLVTSNPGVWVNASSTGSSIGMPPGQMGKAACIMLGRNLRQGTQGDDVKKLQEVLAEDQENDFHGSATGFFGPLTMKAVMKFQMRMGIASSSDGTVGPLTRGFFERSCGKGLDDSMDDVKHGKVSGEISASSASSITIKNAERSIVVQITASTTIQVIATATSTPVTGTIADLTVGKRVMAEGTVNSDGSITAMHIKVGMPPPPPLMRVMHKFDVKGKEVKGESDDQ